MRLTKIAFAAWVSLALFSSFALAERVVFPDALTEIKAGAFENDTSITEVVFGENLTSIGENAFANCKNLKEAWAYNINTVTVESGAFNSVASGFVVHTVSLGKMGACETMSASEIINEGAIPVMPRYRALIVGETYEGYDEKPLAGCKADADSMFQMLGALNLTKYDTSSSDVTKRIDATKSEILNKLEELASESKVTDVTLFYFSGHGDSGGALIGYGDTNSFQNYLFPQTLQEKLHNIKGRKIVIIDACNSGALINRDQRGENNDPQSFTKSFLSAFVNGLLPRVGELADDKGEFQVLVSCSKGEESNNMVESEKEYGLFTRYLQEAIGYDRMQDEIGIMLDKIPGDVNKDSLLTLAEAYQYIKKNVADYIMEYNALYVDDQFEQNVQVWPDNSSFVLFGRHTEN